MRSLRHYVALVEKTTLTADDRLVRKAAKELLYSLSNSGGDWVEIIGTKAREQREWAIDRCYDVYSELEWLGRDGKIPVWRVITAPADWTPGQHPLGEYWSWKEDAAEAHWGNFSKGHVQWLMHGEMAVKDIDWVDTVWKNASPEYESEKEIRLKGGKKVFLKWYRQAGNLKTQVEVNQVMETLTEAPLDRSHAARLQRAREQGFNVDEPHYHGTPGGDFDEFDPERTADEDLAYGKGVYGTRDPDAASGYSQPGSSWGNDGTDDARPTVYKVFMRVKNPFDLDAVYPYAEVRRIFTHCFDEDDLEGIELWTDIQQDVHFDSSSEELNELEERLMELEYKTDHEDYDPDDYEEGRNDPEYISDVEYANDVEEKSIQRQIAFIHRRVEQEHEDHKAALANGRIGGAYGKDIYKALWTNTSEYHDWRAESKLFGGETETFEFKTEANIWLEELGYDGITHVDRYNPGNKGKSHKVTIAFRPEQVRSAHAMFDPEKTNSRKMHESVGAWLYHSTNVPVSAIKRDGLRSSEWEDEEIDDVIGPAEIHHLLFFTDRPQTDFGENVFRFRDAGVPDAYSPDRGTFFHSPTPFAIPPSSIQVLRNGKWVPLMRLTESVEDDDAAYYGFESDWSPTTKWTVIYNRLKQEPNEKHHRDFQRYKALNTEEMKKLRQEPTPTAPEETYKGEHEAPDRGNGAPMHDLSGIFPEDFYGTNGLSHYGGEFPGCYYQVTAMKGRPRGVLKVYRAVPKTLEKPKINPGDWVTIDRRYAVEHGRDNLRNDYRIVSKTVMAKDLYTDGNSLAEWGYDPS